MNSRTETREEILRSTYENARQAAKALKHWADQRMAGNLRRTLVKTAWQVRSEMRGAPMRAACAGGRA